MSSEAAAEADRPRSALQLLGDSRFRRYFIGSLVSNIGTWCHDVAAAIFVFQVTGLAWMVALVAVASFGTALFAAPLGGLLADHFDRRSLLLTSSLIQAVISGALAVVVAVGVREVWVVLAATLVLGMGRAVNTTTLQAFLPSLVPLRDLAQASALSTVTFNIARAVGPALGALVITVFGAGVAFSINAVSFVIFAILLFSLRSPGTVRRKPTGGILGGFRFVSDRPNLILLLVLAALVGMATDPVITLGPSFAQEFGEPEAFAGWLVSAFGVGAVAAAPFLGRIRSRGGPLRTATFGFAGLGIGFAIAGVVNNPVVALAAMVMAGFCFLLASSDITTSLQEQLDEHVRGRVMAIWTIGFQGARPIAALIDGSLADTFSPQLAVLVMAALMSITCVALVVRARRQS